MSLHDALLAKAFGGGVSSWNDLTDRPTDPAWREVGSFNGQSELAANGLSYAIGILWDYFIMPDPIPETLSITFDEVDYEKLSITDLGNNTKVLGNLSFLNSAYGTSFPNTGEPFVAMVTSQGIDFALMDTAPTEHTISVRAYCKPLTSLPVVDLTKCVGDFSSNTTVTGEDFDRAVYDTLCQNDTVLLKLTFDGCEQTIVVHPIHTMYTTVWVRCFVYDNAILGKHLFALDANPDGLVMNVYTLNL